MKTLKRWGWFATIITLGVFAIIALSGCGDLPTAPSNDPTGYENPTAAGSGKKEISKGTLKREVKEVTVVVGTKGDTVSVTLGGNSRECGLFVPPNALRGQTEIGMVVSEYRRRSATGMQYEYEFSPPGLQFKFESTLFLDLNLPDGSAVMLWWFNPSRGAWEFQGIAPVVDGRVSFVSISHFSKYGITCRGKDA